MANKFVDLSGKVFGRLTVIERVFPNTKIGTARFLCSCSCGNTKEIIANSLVRGNTKSCGCLKSDYGHGSSDSYEYRAFYKFKKESNWKSFEAFITDMGLRPAPRHVILRTDETKSYSKENCFWGTKTVLRSFKHGLTNTVEYKTFHSMDNSYWRDFEHFLTDMGKRPSPRHRLLRIDLGLPPSKENCIWSERAIKRINDNKKALFNGEPISFEELASISNVNVATLRWRYAKGYRDEQLIKPIN